MTISTEINNLAQSSALVELYTLDCTPISGSVYRFTPHFEDGGTLVFGGNTYLSVPIQSTGWEVTSTGTQPRPTLTLANVNSTMLSAVQTFGDIVGCKVTRVRTYAKFLDGGSAPDSNAYLPPDVYYIDQKISQDKTAISWQLASILDKFGTKLPRQQITKDKFPGIGMSRGGGW